MSLLLSIFVWLFNPSYLSTLVPIDVASFPLDWKLTAKRHLAELLAQPEFMKQYQVTYWVNTPISSIVTMIVMARELKDPEFQLWTECIFVAYRNTAARLCRTLVFFIAAATAYFFALNYGWFGLAYFLLTYLIAAHSTWKLATAQMIDAFAAGTFKPNQNKKSA